MPTVEVTQGRMHYRVADSAPDGEGDADAGGRPAVVFLHGLLVDSELWSGVAESLGARGVRCLSFDLPLGAHPIALRSDADLTPRGVAGMVLEALAALDLADVTLVGNDTGGAICQFVADLDATSENPRIGRLVLTNCDAFDQFPPPPFGLLVAAGRNPRRLRLMMSMMRSRRLRHSPLGYGPLARHLDPALTLRWVRAAVRDAGVARDGARFMAAIRPAELLEVSSRLHRFTRPVLLLWGTADPFFRLALAHRLEQVLPNARLVEVPGGRTFLPVDDPRRVADEIDALHRRAAV